MTTTATHVATAVLDGTSITSTTGPETADKIGITLSQLQSLKLDETKTLGMVRLARTLALAKTKGDGTIPGLVQQKNCNWTDTDGPTDSEVLRQRRAFVTEFASPGAGSDWIAPLGTIPLARLLDFPAARGFKEYRDANPRERKENLGGAFLICARLVAIEAGSLELPSISSEAPARAQQFTRYVQGTTAEGSSAMGRALQFSLQSKLEKLEDDSRPISATFSMIA